MCIYRWRTQIISLICAQIIHRFGVALFQLNFNRSMRKMCFHVIIYCIKKTMLKGVHNIALASHFLSLFRSGVVLLLLSVFAMRLINFCWCVIAYVGLGREFLMIFLSAFETMSSANTHTHTLTSSKMIDFNRCFIATTKVFKDVLPNIHYQWKHDQCHCHCHWRW